MRLSMGSAAPGRDSPTVNCDLVSGDIRQTEKSACLSRIAAELAEGPAPAITQSKCNLFSLDNSAVFVALFFTKPTGFL